MSNMNSPLRVPKTYAPGDIRESRHRYPGQLAHVGPVIWIESVLGEQVAEQLLVRFAVRIPLVHRDQHKRPRRTGWRSRPG